MKKEDIIKALEELRKTSKKRNFVQSVDLIISLKDMNPQKKPEDRILEYIVLPHEIGKKRKICAIVDKELEVEARKHCDLVITKSDLEKFAKNPKEARKLSKRYDFFIAQATLMPRVGQIFGKFLSSREKMPSPKFSGILTPNSKIEEIVKRIQRTVKISTKKQPTIQCSIGTEKMKDEEIAENALAVYNFILKRLPRGKQQVKNCLIKFTMSKPIELKAK